MNNAVFGKTMENVRKHSNIKLVTTERRRSYLVSQPNYHITKFFTENLLVIEMKKTQTDRPLSKEKNKKVIGLIKDELSGQIMKEFVGLRAKTYSYLKDNNDEDKKAKGTKKCVIKRKLKFQDYKNYLEAAQTERTIKYLRKKKIDTDSLIEDQKEFVKNHKLILKTQQKFKNERHNVSTKIINKIALSSNDDKRM